MFGYNICLVLVKILKTLLLYALLRPMAALKLSVMLVRATLVAILFQTLTADGKEYL